jgi:hypothetical protein
MASKTTFREPSLTSPSVKWSDGGWKNIPMTISDLVIIQVVEWRVKQRSEDHLWPRHHSGGRIANKTTFRGPSLTSSSAFVTLVYLPFGHLTWVLAREYFTEFSRRESWYILPLCRMHKLLLLGCLMLKAGNYLPIDTVWHPWGTESSATPLRDPQIPRPNSTSSSVISFRLVALHRAFSSFWTYSGLCLVKHETCAYPPL